MHLLWQESLILEGYGEKREGKGGREREEGQRYWKEQEGSHRKTTKKKKGEKKTWSKHQQYFPTVCETLARSSKNLVVVGSTLPFSFFFFFSFPPLRLRRKTKEKTALPKLKKKKKNKQTKRPRVRIHQTDISWTSLFV